MYPYGVKYRNLNKPSDSWATVYLNEKLIDEEELVQALKKEIIKEEIGVSMRNIEVLKVSPPVQF